jgi:GTP-binding protein
MRSLTGARLPRLVAEAERDLVAALSGRRPVAMTFLDEATIRVTAGTGGSGCMSFRREMFVPKGGPDGGDGGKGGSVYARVNGQMSTLLDYQYRTHWKAARAQHGKGANKTGKSSDDVYLPVPPGTVIQDADTGEILGELVEPGATLLLARGGRGGRGNARFATPTHQSPREWEPGEEGEDRRVRLILKLIADVGLLGEPNAGKSTLLAALSAARPKIADYPFTTLTPQLGVVRVDEGRGFVLADIPGIIEGAHHGKGLGDRFLRHVERTRVLALLIPLDAPDPQATYALLRREAAAYAPLLAEKPHVVVFTKLDLLPPEATLPQLAAPDARAVLAVSAVARRGLGALREHLWRLVAAAIAAETQPTADDDRDS